MKRRLALVLGTLLVPILTFGLIGCEKKEGGAQQGNDGRVSIRVLNYFSLANPGSANEISRVWDAFDRANPDIRVIREDDFEEPFHLKTEQYAAANRLPDVLYVWPGGRSTTLHSNRLLRDLSPFIQRDNLAGQFLETTLNPVHQAGGYLAMIPLGMTTTSAFYVNQEVLDAVGLKPARTYSELVSQVPVLRNAGYETVIMANADTWVMQSTFFSMVAGRFGGEGWEQRILSGQAKFTDPDFVNALRFIQRMYNDGVLSQATIAANYGDTPGMFATNRGAYMIDGDWRVGAFITDSSTGRALIPPERQSKISITVFPEIEGAKLNNSASITMSTGWAMSSSVPEGSPQEEAAWRLIKWLTGREVQTHMVQSGGLPSPSRVDLDASALNLEPMQVAIMNIGQEFETGTAVFDAVFEGVLHPPLNDGLQAIGMGRQTPEQVASIVQATFDSWKANQR